MGIMGSAFGRALASGGKAASDIANKYIDEELAQIRAQAIADIQFKNAERTRNSDFAFQNDPGNVATRVGTASTVAKAAGRTQTEVDAARLADPALNQAGRDKAAGDDAAAQDREMARLQNVPLIEAARGKAVGDAAAAAKGKNDQIIADANNPDLLAANAKVKLADPQIAAGIAAQRAAANNANASAALHGAQAAGAKLATGVFKKLDGLYEEMGTVLSDPKIDDAERAQRLAGLERQITLMKSRAGGNTRDPELDTVTIVDEKQNDDGTTTKTTRKEVRRPGNGSPASATGDPIKAAMDAARAARNGGGNGGGSSEPTRKDPLTGNSLTEKEWDRKFGRGDFKKLYKPGEDSLKPF